MRLNRNLFALALLIELSSPSQAEGWADLSGRLDQNMTEVEVIKALGAKPNKVELQICGSNTSQPWTCKIYTFGNFSNGIQVLLQELDGKYLVNSWSVYP